MIDRKHIGKILPPAVLDIERGRLRFFAKAIGETNPVYLDERAAVAAGYPSLPAPPTFLFAAELDADTFLPALVEMGVDLGRVLHGEQQFTYLAPVCAGDTVTVRSTIADIYDKKNGALEFLVKESTVSNQHQVTVATIRAIIVIRH
ncbi:MaoC family dehydratase N-terminal domain-containing protein [Duganella aceris]|uniref:MaoC family dehydratase n=1 Tax=Duganella aceris TaxID=2703883 RepID=A0ABX0FKN4_9BURK|nr:MaoC family dehydratase N-terminal domain-containing protein [Duganella aceris]NGZ85149.1 MaoC family dehydratase [Duganella aceris]